MPWFGSSGIKRLLWLIEDEEEEERDQQARKRFGYVARRGGYSVNKEHRQQPHLEGMEACRHQWWESELWKLLHAAGIDDPASRAGEGFRGFLGVPFAIFQEWEAMANTCKIIADHAPGDGKGIRGAATIPLKLKLAGAFVWLRSRATVKFVARFACRIDANTLKRFMTAWARHMVHSYFTVLVHEPSGDELAQVLRLHARLGFPGCVSATCTDGATCTQAGAVDQRTRAPISPSRAWFGTCILHVSCHSHTPPSVYSVEIVGLTLRTPHSSGLTRTQQLSPSGKTDQAKTFAEAPTPHAQVFFPASAFKAYAHRSRTNNSAPVSHMTSYNHG